MDVRIIVDTTIRCRLEYQKRRRDVVVVRSQTTTCSVASVLRRELPTRLPPSFVAIRRPRAGLSATYRHEFRRGGCAAKPCPQSYGWKVRHILRWWHISMRGQHVANAIRGHAHSRRFQASVQANRSYAEPSSKIDETGLNNIISSINPIGSNRRTRHCRHPLAKAPGQEKCPSPDDLEHDGPIWNGGPGSLWFQSMPRFSGRRAASPRLARSGPVSGCLRAAWTGGCAPEGHQVSCRSAGGAPGDEKRLLQM